MTDLNVALKLTLKNLLSGEAKKAVRDLGGIQKAAEKIGGKGAGKKLSQDLALASKGGVKLGDVLQSAGKKGEASFGMTAAALQRVNAGLIKISAEAKKADSALNKMGKGADLGRAEKLARAHQRMAEEKAKASKADRREFRREALARLGGDAYLLGAGAGAMRGAAVGAGAAAAVYGYAKAVKTAITQETAFAEVRKKINLEDGATWADVEEVINRNARAFGVARTEMAGLIAMAGQAGVAYADLERFAQIATKASVAWDMSPKDASEKLAKIKASTGYNMDQIEELADKINWLGDVSASAEKDIVEMFQRASAAAKAADVDFDTTLAATTALNATGMQEEVASRFWNAFSSKLRQASDQPDRAAEGYKLLGLDPKNVENGMKKDARGTILKVLALLEKSADKAKIGSKIFGAEWWDEFIRLGGSLSEIIRLIDGLDKKLYKNSMQSNMDVMLSTTEVHLKRISAVVNEIGEGLGKWALPSINSVLDTILNKFEALRQKQKDQADGEKIGEKAANNQPLSKKEMDDLGDKTKRQAAADVQDKAARATLDQLEGNNFGTTDAEAANLRALIERNRAKIAALRSGAARGNAPMNAAVEARDLEDQIAAAEEALSRRSDQSKAPKWYRPNERLTDVKPEMDRLVMMLEKLKGLMDTLNIVPEESKGHVRAQIQALVEGLKQDLGPNMGPEAKKLMETYANGLEAAGGQATAKARAIAEAIQAVLKGPFSVSIEPKLSTPVPSARPADKPAGKPGKRADAGGGGIQIAQVNVTGVRDLDGFRRQVEAAAGRAVRSAQNGALHDTESGSVG